MATDRLAKRMCGGRHRDGEEQRRSGEARTLAYAGKGEAAAVAATAAAMGRRNNGPGPCVTALCADVLVLFHQQWEVTQSSPTSTVYGIASGSSDASLGQRALSMAKHSAKVPRL